MHKVHSYILVTLCVFSKENMTYNYTYYMFCSLRSAIIQVGIFYQCAIRIEKFLRQSKKDCCELSLYRGMTTNIKRLT